MIRNIFKKIPLASKVYWGTKSFFRKKKIQKNGYNVIKELQKILEDYGVKFFFDTGTLLGIIREGKIISHDMDIDVAVYTEQDGIKALEEHLESKGWKLIYQRTVENIGINEDTFEYMGIQVDLVYYINKGDKDYCYVLFPNPELRNNPDAPNVVEFETSVVTEIKKVPFMNGEVNVPKNTDLYLTERYGNWRVPDKNYVYWESPGATIIENKGTKYVLK